MTHHSRRPSNNKGTLPRTKTIAMFSILPSPPNFSFGVTIELNSENRVEVMGIKEKTDAAKKFMVGDVMISINNMPIETKEQLKRAVHGQYKLDCKIERKITIELERRNLEAIDALGQITPSLKFNTIVIEKPHSEAKHSGIGLLPIRYTPFGKLVLVTDIDDDSPFLNKLSIGDCLLAINGELLRNRYQVAKIFASTLIVITVIKLEATAVDTVLDPTLALAEDNNHNENKNM